MNKIAEFIKTNRKEAGLTQEEFAPPPLFKEASKVAAVSEAAAKAGMYLR